MFCLLVMRLGSEAGELLPWRQKMVFFFLLRVFLIMFIEHKHIFRAKMDYAVLWAFLYCCHAWNFVESQIPVTKWGSVLKPSLHAMHLPNYPIRLDRLGRFAVPSLSNSRQHVTIAEANDNIYWKKSIIMSAKSCQCRFCMVPR